MSDNQGAKDHNDMALTAAEMQPGSYGPCDFPPRGAQTNVHRDISANTNESKGTPVVIPAIDSPRLEDCP